MTSAVSTEVPLKQINGVWFPADIKGEKWKYSFRHVASVEWAIRWCQQRKRTRVAIQAGGNIGLWPKRLAQVFESVITFEPEPMSYACLVENVKADNVMMFPFAVAEDDSVMMRVKRRSVGSHRVADLSSSDEGTCVHRCAIDGIAPPLSGLSVDYLQLDIEGYEWHALMGATETITRCHPIIQVELRNHTKHFGKSDDDVRALLSELGYVEVSRQQGADVVFAHKSEV